MSAKLAVKAAPGAEAGLEARARELANPTHGTAAQSRALVKFVLGGTSYAIELALLDRVVTRLGATGPLAGAPPTIRGLAFIDSVPHVAVDLLERTSGEPRELDALALSPALVLRRDEGGRAVCVEGPLELMDAPAATPVAAGERPGSLEVEGRLADGTLVLSSQWFLAWAASLGEAG